MIPTGDRRIPKNGRRGGLGGLAIGVLHYTTVGRAP